VSSSSRNELVTLAELARSDELALLVDLDGTLIPFARTPAEACLDEDACAILGDIAHAGIRVVVVSGRPRDSIERLRGLVPGIDWIAEHGACRFADGAWHGPSGPATELATLAAAWSPLAARTAGAWIEAKTLSMCFHYRDVPEPDREALASQVELVADEWLESEAEYERLPAVFALEVRRRGVHKGAAVAWLRRERPAVRIIAIGDDVTDEDMFAALAPGDLPVLASRSLGRASRAAVWVDGPEGVRGLLRWLVSARRGDRRPPSALLRPRRSLHRPPTSSNRLLVMSNRTPGPRGDDRGREVGGLVSALEPALRERDGIWLGWSGREREGEPDLVFDEDSLPARASFDYPARWRRDFYAGLCNRALWPLFHGLLDRARYEDADWTAYVEANDAYARFARQLVGPDASIWVHDYHLLLAARALRRVGHRGPIGLFVHVPFPTCDAFETFPWADDLIDAMSWFDLVGFHCHRWAENFRACAATRRGEPRSVAVFPLGIDVAPFTATGSPTSPDVAGLRAELGPLRLLLGVDRLDYSKGIPERLRAYERLLERFPEWRQKVALVQVSVPSRADVPEYAELRRVVENLVGRINGRFGEADWVPVRYLFRSYDHRVLAELYRAAAVALVTPLRDGMNLVAKEFVAAQSADDPGVLVLSRFAGAAVELGDAVLTNPFHLDGLAADLDRALRMPLEERRARHGRMRAIVHATSPAAWAERFLAELERTGVAAVPGPAVELIG
jgi:alpha,alpha-trehalose-phosphate synthase [UDP-forming]/trehalose-phosphatase